MILQINSIQIGSRKKVSPVPFEYPSAPHTLRELITMTVEICAERYNERVRAGESAAKPLSEEDIGNMALVGKIAFGINYGGREQDIRKALDNAVQSFEDGLYRIFLGKEEMTELDAALDLKENDELTFIRLTMLSGRIW